MGNLVNIRKQQQKLKRRELDTIKEGRLGVQVDDGSVESTIRILKHSTEDNYYIERHVDRNKLRNIVDRYELIDEEGNSSLLKITYDVAEKIYARLMSGMPYNDAFIFGDRAAQGLDWSKTDEEHKYTSTGVKFWRHKAQLEEYRKPIDGSARNTIISTHISPEGACNLKCPYCSVTYRDTHSRIKLPRIKKYVEDLMSRGLRAVILTGGGEPTLYPQFNELVQWLKYEKGLSVALITNGTNARKIETETYKCFSWIRVSINIFDGWESKIGIDYDKVSDDCVIGCSMVYTSEHEAIGEDLTTDRLELFRKVSKVADNCGAQYIRLLPNCLLEQGTLIRQHESLREFLKQLEDTRYFQQYKVHGAPRTSKCHQAHFRPYLSEEPWHEDGEPGTVYPCDSVVLNEGVTHFAKKYQLAKLENVLDFVDERIEQKFDPSKDCSGCVFTDNVNMLDEWYMQGTNRFDEFEGEALTHEEFV